MLEIVLNGEKETVPAGTTLADVLARLELSPEVVTVSLNGAVVERSALAQTALAGGDRVEVLLFMGGGR